MRHLKQRLLADLEQGKTSALQEYASDEDTYIRKSAYLCLGRIFFEQPQLQAALLATINTSNTRIRRSGGRFVMTLNYAAGSIPWIYYLYCKDWNGTKPRG